MTHLDSMLERNRNFAAQQSAAGTLMPALGPALPHVKAVVIGCADMRVEPADLLGLAPGEAVVIRNIGGRVTPTTLEELGLLGRIGQLEHQIPGGGGEFHLIVLHHTDCGIKRLAGDTDKLAHYFGTSEEAVAAKSITDPHGSVIVDVTALRAVPALPSSWLLSGLVYDVSTGLVEVVVPPSPVR